MKALILSLLLPLATFAQAVSIPSTLNIEGTEFTGCTYQRHDSAFLYFVHEEGVARVEIAKLPDELKSALGFDAEKSAATKNAILQKDNSVSQALAERDLKKSKDSEVKASREKELAAMKEHVVMGQIVQIFPNGCVIACDSPPQPPVDRMSRSGAYNAPSAKVAADMASWATGDVFVEGLNGKADGERVNINAYKTDGTFQNCGRTWRVFLTKRPAK